MQVHADALHLASCLSQILAALNYASLQTRAGQIERNKRLGSRGEDFAAACADLIRWGEGSQFHVHLVEAPFGRELGLRVESSGSVDRLVTAEGTRIIVTRQRPVDEDERQQEELALIARSLPPPEWILKVNQRRVDPIAVPPCRRVLSDGWPDRDVMALPAVAPDEPLALIDYVTSAELYDRRSGVRLPVFSRSVVLGKAGRMAGCWSALGVPWTVNG